MLRAYDERRNRYSHDGGTEEIAAVASDEPQDQEITPGSRERPGEIGVEEHDTVVSQKHRDVGSCELRGGS